MLMGWATRRTRSMTRWPEPGRATRPGSSSYGASCTHTYCASCAFSAPMTQMTWPARRGSRWCGTCTASMAGRTISAAGCSPSAATGPWTRRRARVRARGSLMAADVDSVADGHLVEDQVLDYLSTRRAVALVAGLSRDQAEAVALRVIAGLDTAAVARLLGKSPGAVRVALHRGLRVLAADPRLRALEEADR